MGWPKGKPRSKETREKIRRSMQGSKNHFFGKKHSSETKEKIRKKKKEYYKTHVAYWTGKQRDEETKRKLLMANIGNKYHWKGGKVIDNGYVEVRHPDHPNAKSNKYVREHRLVIERLIGRPLKKEEVVHHINGIKTDNRPENLICFRNHSAHRIFEERGTASPCDIIFDGRKVSHIA